MYRTTKKKLVRRVGVSTAVALSIAATGIGVANAATTKAVSHAKAVHPSASRTRSTAAVPANCAVGVVTGVTSGSITVKDPSGASVTYTVTSTTTVTNHGTSIALSDVKVGEQVMITVASSGSTVATSIDGGPARGREHGRMDGAGGVITALTSTSITVKDPSGTSTTYSYGSSTNVTKGRSSATGSDLSVGETVMLRLSSTDATTVTSIDIEPPTVMGRVTAVSGDTITVTGRDATTSTIVVSDSTTYAKDGSATGLASVTVGSMIFAQGTLAANGTTLDATTIGIGFAPHGDPGHPGPGAPGVAPVMG